MTLNFKKQYIQSPEGLIQTETIEVQTALEIKEIINVALYKAARNELLLGRYYPYGISKTIGIEEYRMVLKRQNAFLASVEIIGGQGINEEILNAKIDASSDQGMEVEKSGRQILLTNEGVISIEKTNLTEERGKYAIVCKKDKVKEVREFLDAACTYILGNTAEEIKHKTHPEIRRSSPNRWQTQLQAFAETMNHEEG